MGTTFVSMFSARKVKEMKIIAKGRGRKLKTEQFPELSMALEYAFGELDVSEGGGGGLESHPRLITGTLYRAIDNVCYQYQYEASKRDTSFTSTSRL